MIRVGVLAVAVAVPLAFAGMTALAGAATRDGDAVAVPAGASPAPMPTPTGEPSMPASSPTSTAASAPAATPTPTPTMSMPSTPARESELPTPSAEPVDGEVRVVHSIDTADPVFFITVDDGMHRDPQALRMVQEQRIPLTAFLTEWTTTSQEAVDYFTAITAFGGTIENHSMLHASLAEPTTDLDFEICRTQEVYAERFGAAPRLLRPPYGAGFNDPNVQAVAAGCGIDTFVMWNVTVAEGGRKVEYWDPPLRAGDIVLAHFEEDFSASLARIMELAAASGLRPAALTDYL